MLFLTDRLRLALVTETRNWKQTYAKALNEKCAQEMDSIMEFIDRLNKHLSRPIKDLDDVRAAMAALNEIRENEVSAAPTELCNHVHYVNFKEMVRYPTHLGVQPERFLLEIVLLFCCCAKKSCVCIYTWNGSSEKDKD